MLLASQVEVEHHIEKAAAAVAAQDVQILGTDLTYHENAFPLMHITANVADCLHDPVLVLIELVNLFAVVIYRIILKIAGDLKEIDDVQPEAVDSLIQPKPITSFMACRTSGLAQFRSTCSLAKAW